MTTTAAPPVTTTLDPHERVDELLRTVLTQARRQAEGFSPDYPRVWAEIERSARGGKRFRSRLVLATHDALGGPALDAAVMVAAGFELLHTAFLIHDDLIDRDTVRRGRPNLAAIMHAGARAHGADTERARRWADAAAVLAGDLALSRAHRLVAGVDLPAVQRIGLLDLMDETLLVSAGGELDDTAFGLGLGNPGLREALLVCESKTAMYSFRAPLRAGAILAGARPTVVVGLDRAGTFLGRAFQLVDDLLGVFAPEDVIGKSNLSDLREGKLTALVMHARHRAEWGDVAPHFGDEGLDERTAAGMRRSLARSGAADAVAQMVRDDLTAVDDVAKQLPAPLTPVLGAVAAQVRDSLDEVMGHVDQARWDHGRTDG